MTNSRVVHAEISGELGGIPDLAMIVGKHRPKPAERAGANPDPHLRQVPFQKRRDEVLSPLPTAEGLSRRSSRSRERCWGRLIMSEYYPEI